MDSTRARILVVEQRAAGAVCELPETLRSAERARNTSEALLAIGRGGILLVVVDSGILEPDLRAIVDEARKRTALVALLDVDADPTIHDRALAAGCRGVLRPDSTDARVHALLELATAEVQRTWRDPQDFRALESRYEALRERIAQQAQRSQEIQETYFLDLSRVMTIISNIMDGIVFVDRDGNVVLLNPAAEDLLGVKAFAVVGKPLPVMQGQGELLDVLLADHAKLAEARETSQTVEVHHSEQDLLYIKCITSRVYDYRGQPAGALTVLKDVTAEFKTDQLKNQYLSIVAHELRTPLTGIKTFSTMMSKGRLGPLTERQSRVMESIREQSDRLEHQIDKLINLGHLESDEYGQDREPMPLAELCTGLISPFEQPARDRSIALSLRCDVAEATLLFADRSDLRRACQALVENAVKFTPDGGAVDVSIRREADGRLRFCVRDTGIGIDPRYQRRIFEKFFQVEDPLTRHHGGAGLGLFVAKGIVEAHGSRIEVSSKLGTGAEFSFALPEPAAAVPNAPAAHDPARG